MSAPRTLVLDDDDARTTVDARFQASHPSHATHPSRWTVARRSLPLIVSLFLVAVTVGGTLTVVRREQRITNRLREALDALECDRSRPFTETAPGSGPRDTQSFGGSADLLGLSGTDATDRVGLETQGANHLAANDYRAALPYYQLLSTRTPSEQVFIDLLTVLQTKLRCQGETQAKCR